jgi:hypothetical protein
MENQYIERGIYKVRQDGTKDFVAFKTREEKLADDEKKRALILQQVKTFVSDMQNSEIFFKLSFDRERWEEFGGGTLGR